MKLGHKWAALLISSVVLSGCAATVPTIDSRVTTYNDWSENVQPKTFVIQPNKEQANDLEYQSYKPAMEDALLLAGFTETNINDKHPRFGVSFQYESHRNTRTVMREVGMQDPFWYMRPYPYRRFGGPFGPDMVQPVIETYYERRLKVHIQDLVVNKPVYDVTVVNEGGSADFNQVMPYLIRSAFRYFPGDNGATHTVTLEVR